MQNWSIRRILGSSKPLLGGINVAAHSMGAKRTEEDIAMNVSSVGYGFDELFDNMTALNSGLKYRGGRKTEKILSQLNSQVTNLLMW